MGSQPFFIVPKITTKFFILPKNHYLKNKIFKKITTEKIKNFKNNDILYIIHRRGEFFGKFRKDFSKEITTAVVIFLGKTSPANFGYIQQMTSFINCP